MITPAIVSELTRHFEAIRGLESSILDRLRENAVPLHLGKGKLAFDEGSPCSAFVLLTEGVIKVAKPTPQGREILLYRVEPGQTCVLTLNCLLEEISYPARGTVTQECHGAALPRPFFLWLLEQVPTLRGMVLKSLSARIIELMGLVEEVAFHRLDQRLARLLLVTSERHGQGCVERTHQELADELGSVREIVSRILGSFSDDGLVELDRRRIRLLNESGLEQISRGT
jgi:CRP/FNR family transcriptional regulator